MRNNMANTRITPLIQNLIQQDMVVKSQFYPSSMVIQESYCTSPSCNCRQVTLKFLKVNDTKNPDKALFCIGLNIDTFELVDKIIYDESVKVEEIIAEFLATIDAVIKDRINENYKISKGIQEEKVVKTISKDIKELALGGNCISYNEVFENSKTILIRDEKNNLIYIDDSYCMNPECLCNETFISFVEVNELDNSGEHIFTLLFKLKTGRYEVESKACTDERMKDILKSFKKEEKLIREDLNRRYKDMKVIGKQIYTESNVKTAPKVSVLQVGRNDICPCGSGKKYKKCCGR